MDISPLQEFPPSPTVPDVPLFPNSTPMADSSGHEISFSDQEDMALEDIQPNDPPVNNQSLENSEAFEPSLHNSNDAQSIPSLPLENSAMDITNLKKLILNFTVTNLQKHLNPVLMTLMRQLTNKKMQVITNLVYHCHWKILLWTLTNFQKIVCHSNWNNQPIYTTTHNLCLNFHPQNTSMDLVQYLIVD